MNSSTYEKTRIIHVGENQNSEVLEVAIKGIVDSFGSANKITHAVIYGSTNSVGLTFKRKTSLFHWDIERFEKFGFHLDHVGAMKGQLMIELQG